MTSWRKKLARGFIGRIKRWFAMHEIKLLAEQAVDLEKELDRRVHFRNLVALDSAFLKKRGVIDDDQYIAYLEISKGIADEILEIVDKMLEIMSETGGINEIEDSERTRKYWIEQGHEIIVQKRTVLEKWIRIHEDPYSDFTFNSRCQCDPDEKRGCPYYVESWDACAFMGD